MTLQAFYSGCSEYLKNEGFYDLCEMGLRVSPVLSEENVIRQAEPYFDGYCMVSDGFGTLKDGFDLLSGKTIEKMNKNENLGKKFTRFALLINSYVLNALSTAALLGAKAAGSESLEIFRTIRLTYISLLALSIVNKRENLSQAADQNKQYKARLTAAHTVVQITYQIYKFLGGFKSVKQDVVFSVSVSILVIGAKIAKTDAVMKALGYNVESQKQS